MDLNVGVAAFSLVKAGLFALSLTHTAITPTPSAEHKRTPSQGEQLSEASLNALPESGVSG